MNVPSLAFYPMRAGDVKKHLVLVTVKCYLYLTQCIWIVRKPKRLEMNYLASLVKLNEKILGLCGKIEHTDGSSWVNSTKYQSARSPRFLWLHAKPPSPLFSKQNLALFYIILKYELTETVVNCPRCYEFCIFKYVSWIWVFNFKSRISVLDVPSCLPTHNRNHPRSCWCQRTPIFELINTHSLLVWIDHKTSMHSSRMRTARFLAVSPSMHCEGGCLLLGVGVSAPRGGSAPGGGGSGIPACTEQTPPVNRILDTRFWKYYLAPTSLRAVMTIWKTEHSRQTIKELIP